MYLQKTIGTLCLIMIIMILNLYCGQGSPDTKDEKNAGTDSTMSDSSGISGSDSTGKKDQSGDGEKEQKIDAIPVEVTTINKGTISAYILLSTNLETEKMTNIYSRIQGVVEKIYTQEGDRVGKNQVLLQLEGEEYRLAEERAHLNYLQSESEFNRLKTMFEEDLLSKEEFEKARYTTEGLKVEWDQAKLNLSYTKIKSPISGIVGDRSVKIGDRIQPTQQLYTVINTDEMIAVVYTPEKELGNVRKGQTAYISSENIVDKRFTGWIKRVSPVVDPQSGTFKVTIGVKNIENQLRSGMFVNAHIVIDTHEDVVLIPKTAIVYENEMMNIFVVRDSIAHKVALDVGFQDHEKVESLSKIEEGDKVIVVGQAGLKDQTKVKIVSERKIEFANRQMRKESASS
jgi:membrane fusion protein (multidrug efflux system)